MYPCTTWNLKTTTDPQTSGIRTVLPARRATALLSLASRESSESPGSLKVKGQSADGRKVVPGLWAFRPVCGLEPHSLPDDPAGPVKEMTRNIEAEGGPALTQACPDFQEAVISSKYKQHPLAAIAPVMPELVVPPGLDKPHAFYPAAMPCSTVSLQIKCQVRFTKVLVVSNKFRHDFLQLLSNEAIPAHDTFSMQHAGYRKSLPKKWAHLDASFFLWTYMYIKLKYIYIDTKRLKTWSYCWKKKNKPSHSC